PLLDYLIHRLKIQADAAPSSRAAAVIQHGRKREARPAKRRALRRLAPGPGAIALIILLKLRLHQKSDDPSDNQAAAQDIIGRLRLARQAVFGSSIKDHPRTEGERKDA